MHTNGSSGTYGLLLISVAFHLIYVNSIFDCHFFSPLVHGMSSYGSQESGQTPLAKRLVLIVADGLRADLLFEPNSTLLSSNSTETVAPHLRSIAEFRGAYGISHTRIPTESMPGHLAIISGLYEDVVAITKGWKSYAMDSDSVFNRSSTTFAFGSPIIMQTFQNGTSPGKMKTWSLEQREDYTKDATFQDVWVLDQFKSLLKNATIDVTLRDSLRKEKVIIFLHLLGIDTTGHSYGPHSKEYMYNIQVVDDIVREIEMQVDQFFQDNSTSFIFTADHGMSATGNHGDGHPDNTMTPLIAWGSGLRGPLQEGNTSSHDKFSQTWQLNHLMRRDVEQADIAALIATLIGIDWPVNCVGILPDIYPRKPGYLHHDVGEKFIAQTSATNARVILEHYRVRDELHRKDSFFYTPYHPATYEETADVTYIISEIEWLIARGKWHEARQLSLTAIRYGLGGLHYLQTYNRLLVRSVVIVAYTGWAAYTLLCSFESMEALETGHLKRPSTNTAITVGSLITLIMFWVLFTLQSLSLRFYFYISFPIFFWHQVAVKILSMRLPMKLWHGTPQLLTATYTLVGLIGIAAGYMHQSVWSIDLFIIGLLWPAFWEKRLFAVDPVVTTFWVASCLITSIFPFLSPDKTENKWAIVLGVFAMLLTGYKGLMHIRSGTQSKQNTMIAWTVIIQSIMILITLAVTVSSINSLQARSGVPLINQRAGWAILAVATITAFVLQNLYKDIYGKALTLFLGFGPCFVILSISVECLFFVSFSTLLMAWVCVEQTLSRVALSTTCGEKTTGKAPQLGGKRLEPDHIRIALFFLLFVQVAFFGTGNKPSLSSFYLTPVFRLITTFNPFYVLMLLTYKIIGPFMMLAVAFASLNNSLALPRFYLLFITLSIANGITLAFFLNVKDTDSWQEIGQSLTNFCIASMLLIWAVLFCVVGEYLMKDALTKHRREELLSKNN